MTYPVRITRAANDHSRTTMGSIYWEEHFSVDNEELDSQHQEMIRLYNQLHKCLLDENINKLYDTKMNTLQSLRHYVIHHFAAEEQYMQEIGYPNLTSHQTQHRQFSKKIDQLYTTFTDGQIVLSTSLMKIIRNWIREHITTEDAKYRDFAKSR